MYRESMKQLIEELRQEMQERKPYESIPYGLDETIELPVSMRSVTNGSNGETAAEMAQRTIDRIEGNLPQECRGENARKIIAKEAIAQSNGYFNSFGPSA